jgi:hypothetical protein
MKEIHTMNATITNTTKPRNSAVDKRGFNIGPLLLAKSR